MEARTKPDYLQNHKNIIVYKHYETMPKIKHEVEKCIGCGSCAALCPKYFEMADNGKAHVIGSVEAEIEELEVEKIECAESAAEACPVQCIHVEK